MRTRGRILTPLLSLILAPALTGCSTVAKQAFQEFRGARSKILLIHELPADALAPYQTVRIDPVTTTVGDRLCPPQLRHYYDQATAELALELRDEYPGGASVLHVSPEILYFQEKGLLNGAECLARVRMRDDARQSLIVDAIVRTESKAFRAGGEKALAESSVEAIGKFLENRGGEPKEDEEDEERDEADRDRNDRDEDEDRDRD